MYNLRHTPARSAIQKTSVFTTAKRQSFVKQALATRVPSPEPAHTQMSQKINEPLVQDYIFVIYQPPSLDTGYDSTHARCLKMNLKTYAWYMLDLDYPLAISCPKVATMLDGKILVANGTACHIIDMQSAPILFKMTDSMPEYTEAGTITVLQKSGHIVCNGSTSFYDNRLDVYNPSTGKWKAGTMVKLDGSTHTETVALQGGDKVLHIGGFPDNGDIPLSFCQVYTHSTQSFETKASLPLPTARVSACLLPNGHVFVSGGIVDRVGPTSRCFEYDPDKDTWEELPGMHGARYNHGCVYSADNNAVIVFGGSINNVPTATCDGFSLKSQVWTRIGQMPVTIEDKFGYTVY